MMGFPRLFENRGPGDWFIANADCLEAMASADDDCVDHVFSDPPYERHMHVSKADKAHPRGRKIRGDGYAEIAALNFDSIEPIRDEAARHMVRLSRGWLVVFCTPEGVAPWRDAIEAAGGRYKRACVWIKPDAAPQFNGQGPAMGCEMFIVAWCGTGFSRWNAGGKRGVYTHATNPPERDGRHPTEKPVALMREIIRDFTQPGDLIFDPFLGSGTTAVAALAESRSATGCEIDPDYCAVAAQRIDWQSKGVGPLTRLAQKHADAADDAGPLFGGGAG